MIEKTLEAKGSEIFQKILDVIDKMQRPSPPPLPPDNPINEEQIRPPPPEPADDDSRGPMSQEISNIPGPSQSSSGVSTTFELPIDLLELPSFVNPSKQDLKKSSKHRVKGHPDMAKEGNRGIRTSSKQDTGDRKTSLKARDGAAKTPKEKEEGLKAEDLASDETGKKVVENKSKDSETSDSNPITAVTTAGISSNKRQEKEVEKETTEERITGLEDREELKRDTSPDLENSSKSGLSTPEPKPIVRRSARIASIGSEEKKYDAGSGSSRDSSSKGGGRKRKESFDIEMISEDEIDELTDSNNLLPTEEDIQIKIKSTKIKLHSSKKKSSVSSGSEEEKDTEQKKQSRKRGRRRAASISTLQQLSPTTSPPAVSPPHIPAWEGGWKGEDDKTGVKEAVFEEEIVKERNSRTKRRRKF